MCAVFCHVDDIPCVLFSVAPKTFNVRDSLLETGAVDEHLRRRGFLKDPVLVSYVRIS